MLQRKGFAQILTSVNCNNMIKALMRCFLYLILLKSSWLWHDLATYKIFNFVLALLSILLFYAYKLLFYFFIFRCLITNEEIESVRFSVIIFIFNIDDLYIFRAYKHRKRKINKDFLKNCLVAVLMTLKFRIKLLFHLLLKMANIIFKYFFYNNFTFKFYLFQFGIRFTEKQKGFYNFLYHNCFNYRAHGYSDRVAVDFTVSFYFILNLKLRLYLRYQLLNEILVLISLLVIFQSQVFIFICLFYFY